MSTKSEARKNHQEWRLKVLDRDKCCQVCGKLDGVLNAHHLLPKQFKEFRYDFDNGMILCFQHHKVGKYSAHQNPIWFYTWLQANKPKVLDWVLMNMQ